MNELKKDDIAVFKVMGLNRWNGTKVRVTEICNDLDVFGDTVECEILELPKDVYFDGYQVGDISTFAARWLRVVEQEPIIERVEVLSDAELLDLLEDEFVRANIEISSLDNRRLELRSSLENLRTKISAVGRLIDLEQEVKEIREELNGSNS